MKVLEIKSWKTKATDYPVSSFGSTSITKTVYKKGLYLMEGVDGYELYHLKKSAVITELRINDEVVMVDDPLHWIGMQRLAEACKGKVLIGGLGLGLILHHLAMNNDVSEVKVVEINSDVINLIKSLLPKDDRVEIVNDDVFNYEYVHGNYDTIVLDLWVRGEDIKTKIAGLNEEFPPFIAYLRFKANNDELVKPITKAPLPTERLHDFEKVQHSNSKAYYMVSVEPKMKCNPERFASLLKQLHLDFVSIGADSRNNRLPEPSASEVYMLLDLLKQFTFIVPKKNLNRLLNKEKN